MPSHEPTLAAQHEINRDEPIVYPRRPRTGAGLPGAAGVDLELIDRRTLDANIQELAYTPILHI